MFVFPIQTSIFLCYTKNKKEKLYNIVYSDYMMCWSSKNKCKYVIGVRRIERTQFDHVIYVYSGKGGVGKSTFSTNLAYSLSNLQNKMRVGLFDADFEGPSISKLTAGLGSVQTHMDGLTVNPVKLGNVYVQSIGFFEKESNGVFLNREMINGALEQLLLYADWNVDVLIIDLPPGTSEFHRKLLTLIKGQALLLSTPNQLGLSDTYRGIDLLNKYDIPIMGLIKNMAYIDCGNCDERTYLGDEHHHIDNQVLLLDHLPFDYSLAQCNGETPYVIKEPTSSITKKFKALSARILDEIQG